MQGVCYELSNILCIPATGTGSMPLFTLGEATIIIIICPKRCITRIGDITHIPITILAMG